MNREQVSQMQAFIVALADHYDAPGPSPEKTAEHYQMAEKARLYRAMILTDLDPIPPRSE